MQKHSTKTAKTTKQTPRSSDIDKETAEAQKRVLDALHELLRNPETPSELFQECSEFVTDQSNECGENLYHSIPYLTEVLKSVKPEERMGAVEAARNAEKGGVQ